MAEVLTIAAPLAASGVIYQTAVSMGLPEHLALPVALCAAVGASFALSAGGRVEFDVRSVLSALAVYLFSWALGVFFGPAASAALVALAPETLAKTLPHGALAPGCALVIAAIGQSKLLPMALDAFSKRNGE
jgi:hypothetical protein